MTKLDRDFEVSRDASEYEPKLHLLQRLREGGERKVLEYEMIAEAIEEGEVIEQRTKEEVVINHQWLMTELNVVVNYHDKVIETAYEVTES